MNGITKDSFLSVPKDIASAQKIHRPSLSYWQDAWRRLKLNRAAMVSMWFVLFMVVVAIVGPMIFPDYKSNYLDKTFLGPSLSNWFGTDELGRDLFTRVIRGTRISLFIGITVSVITTIIGVIYGGISGYFGGLVDDLMMRFIDIVSTIPDMIILILLLVIIEPGVGTLILAMSLTSWAGIARIVRGQILQIKEQDYVLVARTQGASATRIITRHLIPNTLGPIIVRLTMAIPAFIFEEAFLSFINLGVQIPEASWGNLGQAGVQYLGTYPYLLLFPAVFLCTTTLALNLFGDGLRDALDPRMRK
jgi:oligopeptide transport system permease protein